MKALPILMLCFVVFLTTKPGHLAAAGDAAASGDDKTGALAGAEQVSMVKSMSQMKLIVGNCLLWAGDHNGKFPLDLKDLLTDKYLGKDQDQLLHCPLLNDSKKIGYYYYGKKLYDAIPDEKVLVLSQWTSADGRRLIGRKNGSVTLEVPKQEDFLIAAQEPAPPAKSTPDPTPPVVQPQPKNPVPATASTAASTTEVPAPAIKLSTSISSRMRLGERYRVSFPPSQMPSGKENYLWIVEHPNRLIETAPLTKDIWSLHSDGPGVYKIHLEFRAGLDKHAVSNVVEITVP